MYVSVRLAYDSLKSGKRLGSDSLSKEMSTSMGSDIFRCVSINFQTKLCLDAGLLTSSRDKCQLIQAKELKMPGKQDIRNNLLNSQACPYGQVAPQAY